MASRPIRVLVVDDSAVMREMISDYVAAADGMEVVGKASDGKRALDMLASREADVVTLDVQMPHLDGLATLDAILQSKPVPVIMVSSLTQRGAGVTLDALERGALDYVAKPETGADTDAALRDELLRKIRTMAGTDVRRMLEIRRERKARMEARKARGPIELPPPVSADVDLNDKCIAIGISTGGPPALTSLFETLAPPTPPIVVVQHMPANFTAPFAWRLNSVSRLSIKEASAGDVLKPSHVYIAPGGQHLYLRKEAGQVKIRLREGEAVSGHKPSVDVMMTSAAEIYGSRCLGVIMTGMGRDGVEGCKQIRAAGGFALGQDEQSSDVYGMNKVAFVDGAVDRQFSLDDAATTIVAQMRRLWRPSAVAVG